MRCEMTDRAGMFAAVALTGLLLAAAPVAAYSGGARTLIWKMENLELAKQQWLAGDLSVTSAVERVLYLADRALRLQTVYTVTTKEDYPSYVTPNDFFSTQAYAWPNPDTEDGLPWIILDGFNNPGNSHDGKQLQNIATDVQALSLAYFFTGDQTYTDWARQLLRIFFVDPATRMNPEVRYASTLPGTTSSGGFNVAGQGNTFRRLLDPIALMEGSPSWTASDKAAMQQWASDFRDFMFNDPVALRKLAARDNHGTNYDMLSALLSLYLEDDQTAREWLLHYRDRIDEQFNPDGTQRFPLARADSQLYHEYNLRIAMDLAEMADHFADIDLWGYQAADGGGMISSIEFLIPYFTAQKSWDLWPTENVFSPQYHNWYRLWVRVADDLDDLAYLGYADIIRVFNTKGFDYEPVNIIHPFVLSVDTDDDGLTDRAEAAIGSDPLNADTDGDGLSDGDEVKIGSNPMTTDTDGDGFDDGDEINYNSDPLVQTDTPANGDVNEDGVVNVVDVLLTTRIITGELAPTNDQLVRCDVAPFIGGIPVPNGEVNAGDLIRIQQMALGP